MRTVVLRPLIALALAALVLAGCGNGAGGDVAATVGGEEIERELLERMVRAQLDAQGIDPEGLEADERAQQVEPLQRNMLSALIQFEILGQVADEHDVEVTEEDIDEAFDREVEQFGGEDAYEEATGFTEQEFRDLVVATQLRLDGLQASQTEEVTEDELRDAYDEQVETRFETRTIRHILVESQEEADDVVSELEDGADFGELAEERSEDPGSAEQGGEMPPQPRGQFVEEFDDAAWEAEIGELVGPVETEFGFHVLEVLEAETQEFEDVRDDLEAEMGGPEAQQAVEAIIQSAFEEIDVDVDGAYGEWDSSTGTVVDPDAPDPEDLPAEGEQPPGGELPEDEIPEELREELEEMQRQMEEEADGDAQEQ